MAEGLRNHGFPEEEVAVALLTEQKKREACQAWERHADTTGSLESVASYIAQGGWELDAVDGSALLESPLSYRGQPHGEDQSASQEFAGLEGTVAYLFKAYREDDLGDPHTGALAASVCHEPLPHRTGVSREYQG